MSPRTPETRESTAAHCQPRGRLYGVLLTACALCVAIPSAAEPAKPAAPSPAEPVGAAEVSSAPPTKPNKAGPWSLAEAVDSPDWLYFSLAHRVRYEHIFKSFRQDLPGDGGLLSLRTNLFAELRFAPVKIGAELVDSRAYLSNEVSAPNTTIVDALALLQAYAAVDLKGLIDEGDDLHIQAGRMTMDVGSRRLVARNRFRNTINGFTGVDIHYHRADNSTVRLFANLPIERLPKDADSLADNAIAMDRESFDVIFGGVFVSLPPVAEEIVIEGYAFGLYERDSADRPSRNRRLATPGFRVFRSPQLGEFDFELESAVQLGKSRSSTSQSDVTDLDHLALFQHAQAGYTFVAPEKPRIVAQYDYTSGDASPKDGSNNRFDTLFGARRFELGPTGIYGAFARSNIVSPGARVELTPHKMLDGFVGWRAFWLESNRDSWTGAGVRDATGASGSFVGHQLEARARFNPFGKNLGLEVGFAHLFPGQFVDRAPNANPASDTTLLYTQLSGQL